jgi:hypothetical protein
MGYVYRHVRLDNNEVFYIGISKQNNNYMRARQIHKRNIFWKNIVAKTEFRYDILWECNSEKELLEKEKEFISIYGRKDIGSGTLCNLTDGGDGVHNFKHTDESRRRMAKAREGKDFSKIYTLEVRLKMSIGIGGKKRTPEQRKKISDSRKGKNLKGENNNAKIILDTHTGIFYDCAKDVSDLMGINYSTFKSWLKGRVKSKNRYKYV